MTEEELIAKARKAFPLECIEDYLQHSDGDNLVLQPAKRSIWTEVPMKSPAIWKLRPDTSIE